MGVILSAHSIRGESHIQRNANEQVATTSPPYYYEPHWLHLFMKAAPGTTFISWLQHHFVVIGKPEQLVHKASHCGSKQQKTSPDEITLLLFVRGTYIWVLFRTSRSWWIAHSTQCKRRSCSSIMVMVFTVVCFYTGWSFFLISNVVKSTDILSWFLWFYVWVLARFLQGLVVLCLLLFPPQLLIWGGSKNLSFLLCNTFKIFLIITLLLLTVCFKKVMQICFYAKSNCVEKSAI